MNHFVVDKIWYYDEDIFEESRKIKHLKKKLMIRHRYA